MNYREFFDTLPDCMVVAEFEEVSTMAEHLMERMDTLVRRIDAAPVRDLPESIQAVFADLSGTVVPGEEFVRRATRDFALALLTTLVYRAGSPEWIALAKRILATTATAIPVAHYMITKLDAEVAAAVALATNSN